MTNTLQLDRRIEQTVTSLLLPCTALTRRCCHCNLKLQFEKVLHGPAEPKLAILHSRHQLHLSQWQVCEIAATELGPMLHMLTKLNNFAQQYSLLVRIAAVMGDVLSLVEKAKDQQHFTSRHFKGDEAAAMIKHTKKS